MSYLFLVALIAGLLLAVRLMFFGAERRRQRPGAIPLRRSEPALVGFLVMFGLAGSLLDRHGDVSPLAALGTAALLGGAWAALVARVAIAMARVAPEHDPDDPRYALQGHVGRVIAPIAAGGEGLIALAEHGAERTVRARAIDDAGIEAEAEVCIDRLEDGVAWVERWALVEARL